MNTKAGDSHHFQSALPGGDWHFFTTAGLLTHFNRPSFGAAIFWHFFLPSPLFRAARLTLFCYHRNTRLRQGKTPKPFFWVSPYHIHPKRIPRCEHGNLKSQIVTSSRLTFRTMSNIIMQDGQLAKHKIDDC